MKKLWVVGLVLFSTMSWASVPTKESQLIATAFDEKSPMEVRWGAYQKLVKTQKDNSLSTARRALKSRDWFLRQAGLTTLVVIKPLEAKSTARDLLQNDPSMLVRAQALSAIKILDDKDSEAVLWQALDDKKNFRGDQSLWIRPKIVATLMEFKMGKKEQFQKLLEDKDSQIQRLAQIALAK